MTKCSWGEVAEAAAVGAPDGVAGGDRVAGLEGLRGDAAAQFQGGLELRRPAPGDPPDLRELGDRGAVQPAHPAEALEQRLSQLKDTPSRPPLFAGSGPAARLHPTGPACPPQSGGAGDRARGALAGLHPPPHPDEIGPRDNPAGKGRRRSGVWRRTSVRRAIPDRRPCAIGATSPETAVPGRSGEKSVRAGCGLPGGGSWPSPHGCPAARGTGAGGPRGRSPAGRDVRDSARGADRSSPEGPAARGGFPRRPFARGGSFAKGQRRSRRARSNPSRTASARVSSASPSRES